MLVAVPETPDVPPQPAEFYRREAAKLRKTAEGVTTRVIRERLLDLAREFDQRAEEAETATRRQRSV